MRDLAEILGRPSPLRYRYNLARGTQMLEHTGAYPAGLELRSIFISICVTVAAATSPSISISSLLPPAPTLTAATTTAATTAATEQSGVLQRERSGLVGEEPVHGHVVVVVVELERFDAQGNGVA